MFTFVLNSTPFVGRNSVNLANSMVRAVAQKDYIMQRGQKIYLLH